MKNDHFLAYRKSDHLEKYISSFVAPFSVVVSGTLSYPNESKIGIKVAT